MANKVMGVGAEAVAKATGRDWEAWFALLDEAGARAWDHKRMVAFVAEQGLDSGWWQQMITSGYERARGLKLLGQSSGVGFQIGVQRTLPIGAEALWELLWSPAGLALWIGEIDALSLEKGARYETRDGTTGEVRSVRAGQRVRLTWQPKGLAAPTTLQLTLSPKGPSRTALRFHQEKLADSEHRERMRARWKAAATALKKLGS